MKVKSDHMTPTEMIDTSNNVQGIDILGSWMELGMMVAVVSVGLAMGWGFMRNMINYKRSKNDVQTPIKQKYLMAHNRIFESLTELRIKAEADRVSLIQFHNGGALSYGHSLKKWSITHESCSRGITESMNGRQDVLVTTCIPLLNKLESRDRSIVMVSDDIESNFKRTLDLDGTIAYSVYPIYGLSKINIVGCVIAEWCAWDGLERVDEETMIVDMTTTAKETEALLFQDG